jgi:hypothetical protein
MEIKPYIVYIKINDFGYITAINSSKFLTDTTGWIEIDSGYDINYKHAQNNYFALPVRTRDGAYNYKMVDGSVVECTVEEIAEQEDAYKPIYTPSQLDVIEAQVVYTAMMTDTLLEV